MYKVVNNSNTYDILEKSTGNIIVIERKEDVARNICRKLNLGGGFNGYTPAFFLDLIKS
jgi:hypothetical protein